MNRCPRFASLAPLLRPASHRINTPPFIPLASCIRSTPTIPANSPFLAHQRFASSASETKRALDSAASAYLKTTATKSKKKGVRSIGLVQPVQEAEGEGLKRLETHRASAFSTAETYDFDALLPILEDRYTLLPFIADDVYHLRLSPQSEAFFFNNGVLVTWNATDEQIEELLMVAQQVGNVKYADLEVEWFDYVVDADQLSRGVHGGIQNEIIIIGNDLPSDQSKLAYSSGLARSAKLASLENLLDAHLHKTRHIPDLLLKGKKLPLGRKTVLQSLGELFSLRGHVNLHSELLDLPDFCWSSPKMEDAFATISRNLDVRARIAIFNKKLDYANELAEVLRNHLHEEHATKLEWAVIWLIAIEIAFEVVHYYEKMVAWREEEEEEREEEERRVRKAMARAARMQEAEALQMEDVDVNELVDN
ncbi:hypothetical protein HDU98_007671 [Podochytrium sp. JEL0797]|nr:hypothetical protein HDU98_007671 [Podochytrium sp. JEL0797]